MWAPLVRLAFGLAFAAQMVSSRTVAIRQEQCASAKNDAEKGACDMKAAFGGSSIIPQLLPDYSPKAALSVRYGNVVIGGAQQMSPSKVATQPLLSLSFISSNSEASKQAYIILGLDYQPQAKAIRPFWLQPSAKIDGTTGDMTSPVEPLINYRPPNPAQGSGTIAYIFLVFQDPGLALSKQSPQVAAMISGAFDLQAFLATMNLVAVFKSTFDGVPINGQTSIASAAPGQQGQAPQRGQQAAPQDQQVPQQGQQVTPSSPVTSRVTNGSTNAVPTAISPAQTPTQSFPEDSPASPTTPVTSASQIASAPTQYSETNQTETGQNATASFATNLASQKYSTSLAAVIVLGVSFL